jgi:asparagine synthase (glutamine-hydrolysing)
MQSWRKTPRFAREVAEWILRLMPEAHDGRHLFRRVREFSSAGLLDESKVYPLWLSTFTPQQKAALYSGDIQNALVGRDAWEPIQRWAYESGETDPAARAMYVDLHSFLPNNVLHYGDRMSMAHGLELRVPFADRSMVETMAAVPAGCKLVGRRTKKVLRESMKGRLPAYVLNRKKSGFNPPMGIWLTTALREMAEEMLSESSLARRGWFDSVSVRSMWDDHVSCRRDHTWHLWALLVLESWARR